MKEVNAIYIGVLQLGKEKKQKLRFNITIAMTKSTNVHYSCMQNMCILFECRHKYLINLCKTLLFVYSKEELSPLCAVAVRGLWKISIYFQSSCLLCNSWSHSCCLLSSARLNEI